MAGDLLLIGVFTAFWAWLGAQSEEGREAETQRARVGGRDGRRPGTDRRPNDEGESRPVA